MLHHPTSFPVQSKVTQWCMLFVRL